ncbi:hypothetical protein ASG43_21495 [Aureimonas sp. Leaf454]|uniref:hypothetical protein n=1 Tax=Aureimonas sp. Leaf454 TaxID=1736381 RepID=UPI0006F69054|nr:hypothetical protein [Aureimonas sp. Leaf454]KQT51182.1 hypothetical protein ASG43_21495 [Aureimonas sp. Leaf454]
MSDIPSQRPLGPDLTNARLIDRWTIRGWSHDPVLVGIEDGVEVVIPIGGVILSIGWAHLRDNTGTLRLGNPADDAPSPWDLMAISEGNMRAAAEAEAEAKVDVEGEE